MPEQLRLLETARREAKAGKHERALALLDELERTYPKTPLRAELELSRADWLTRAGKARSAIDLIERLLDDPQHAGRKPELLHTLGDLWLSLGDCARATPAFENALSQGLSEERAAAAHRGLARCQAEK